MFKVTIPTEPVLPNFQAFLDYSASAKVTVAEFNPSSEAALLQLWRLVLCQTLCSHVSPTLLPSEVATTAHSASMPISLDVMMLGVPKVIQFFQISNLLDKHSGIFPVPDDIAYKMGIVVTTNAHALSFERVWNNLSTYITSCLGNNSCPCTVPSIMQVTVHYSVPARLLDHSLQLMGQVCPCGQLSILAPSHPS